MIDELDQDPQELQTSEPTGTDQAKNSKVFTQSEVDKIVKERLDREKANTRKAASEQEEYRNGISNQIAQYETIIQKVVEAKMVEMPDNLKTLLGKLPLLEQMEYLSDEKNLPSRKMIPVTPKESEGVLNTKAPKKIKLF